jgi:hypothetical protein
MKFLVHGERNGSEKEWREREEMKKWKEREERKEKEE